MKEAALRLLVSAGAFAPLRLANRGKALVLMYHRFGAGDAALPAEEFARQLEYLSAHYRLLPLSELAARMARGEEPPPGAACITIDDGFRDAYEVAFPLLKKFGAPATVYVVTDFLDGRCWVWTDKTRYLLTRTSAPELIFETGDQRVRARLGGRTSRLEAAARVNAALKRLPDEEKEAALLRLADALGVGLPELPPDEYAPVSWEQAREMDAAGVEVGSHTVTHPLLTRVEGERLRRELRESRARLEDALGRRVDAFCYPDGAHDRNVISEAEAAGYRHATTTLHGFNGRGTTLLALRRISTQQDLAHFVQSTSGAELLKVRLRGLREGAEPIYGG